MEQLSVNNFNNMDFLSTQHYISILEKTNQQFSLWMNPYGIMVGVLAVLVTVLTIAAVFIVHRQGKEYKQSFNKALEDYKNSLNKKINEIGEESKSKIQIVVEKYQGELESLKAASKSRTDDSREKINILESKIKELERQKESISSQIQFSAVSENKFQPLTLSGVTGPTGPISFANNTSALNPNNYCSNCGHSNGWTTIGNNYCSNCGKKLNI